MAPLQRDQVQMRPGVPDLIRGLPSDEGAHAVHGGITADVGDVIAAVALAQVRQVLKVHIIRHLNLLYTISQKLLAWYSGLPVGEIKKAVANAKAANASK